MEQDFLESAEDLFLQADTIRSCGIRKKADFRKRTKNA